MSMELQARSPEGAALVASAERLAGVLADGAAARDRDGSYPFDGIAALRRAGYFGAPVPEELGGLGVLYLLSRPPGVYGLPEAPERPAVLLRRGAAATLLVALLFLAAFATLTRGVGVP